MERGAVRSSAITIAVLLTALCVACADSGPPESARVVMTQQMAPMDGGHPVVTVVEVRYGPGGSSAPHRHPCPVVGYVIAGALRTQVAGGPAQVFQAGESFYEPANGIHQVSANASDRQPVRFTATFLCERDIPLSVPVTP